MQVAGSVVVVTGASAGIGAATVEALARRGADVVLVARRAERLADLVERLQALPGRRLALPGDIADPAFCRQVVAETVAAFGRIDVLINNAGVGHTRLLVELTPDDMHRILDTNVLGLMHLTQAALAPMQAAGRGQIIHVSSIVGQRPLPRGGFYAGTKAMVNFLGRGLRMELRGSGIAVTLVYPGLTATEFHLATLGGGRPLRGNVRGVSAARVAQAIVGAIEHRRREVYVTWYDWGFTHLCRLFPRTVDALLPPVLAWLRRRA